MNRTSFDITERKISIQGVLWNLLSQWKAVVVAALIMAVLLTGLKYYRDSNNYKEELNRQKEAEEINKIPEQERIDTILAGLSEADRSDVEYVINARQWIREQREHLNNSIALNENPTNQRTLSLEYQISAEKPGYMPALVFGYLGAIGDEDNLEIIGKAIGSDIDSRYVAEAINYEPWRYTSIDSECTGTIFELRIVLPEDSDPEKISEAVTSCLTKQTREFADSLGAHTIKCIASSEYRKYQPDYVSNRTNLLYGIYNIQNNLNNGKTELSDKAVVAIEAIDAINIASEAVTETEGAEIIEETLSKPGISKKFVILGFILGVVLYAFVYAFAALVRGRLISAEDLKLNTTGRLFGEVYTKGESSLSAKLFQDRIISKYRMRNKGDKEQQLEMINASIVAAGKHREIDSISLFCIPDEAKAVKDVVESIAKNFEESGIKASVIEVGADFDESSLLGINNGIIVAGKGSEVSDLYRIEAFCQEYGIHQMGSIFVNAV